MMNTEQLGAAVRHLVTALGGIAVGTGYISENQLIEISGAIAALVAFGWSFYLKRNKSE